MENFNNFFNFFKTYLKSGYNLHGFEIKQMFYPHPVVLFPTFVLEWKFSGSIEELTAEHFSIIEIFYPTPRNKTKQNKKEFQKL